MLLRYASDLHLEMEHNDIPTFIAGTSDEMLVLDGDILLAWFLQRHRTDKEARKHQNKYSEFLLQLTGFKKIFLIMGNHEHYYGYLELSAAIIRTWLYDVLKLSPEQYIVLDNDTVPLNDTTLLVGGTLWTDMRKDHPDTHWFVGRGMNDFKVIRIDRKDKSFEDSAFSNIFSTYRAMAEHAKTRAYIAKVADENKDKRIIVATHHAPSYESNGNSHRTSMIIDGYCSDMEKFILERPNITDWIHGHTHENMDYHIGTTRITTNMRGYVFVNGHSDYSAVEFTKDRFIEKYIEV